MRFTAGWIMPASLVRISGALFPVFALAMCGLAFYRGHWEARWVAGSASWIIPLPRAPVWSPPSVPGKEAFEKAFGNNFQAEGGQMPEAGGMVAREFRLGPTWLDAAWYLWAISMAFGLGYLVRIGDERNRWLHLALWLGAAFTGAAAICVGWAWVAHSFLPHPEWFGVMGLVTGVVGASVTYGRDG